MSVNWNEVTVEGKNRKSDTVTKAVIEGALQKPNLSGAQIAKILRDRANLDAKDQYASVVASVCRATAEVLVTLGEINVGGRMYALTPVAPKPELVRKPA